MASLTSAIETLPQRFPIFQFPIGDGNHQSLWHPPEINGKKWSLPPEILPDLNLFGVIFFQKLFNLLLSSSPPPSGYSRMEAPNSAID